MSNDIRAAIYRALYDRHGAATATQYMLFCAMRDRGLSVADVAAHLGCAQHLVWEWLAGLTIDSFADIVYALDCRPGVEIVDMAAAA